MWGIISRLKALGGRLIRSVQLRYAAAYLLVTGLVLILLNVYPLRFAQDLVFRTKEVSVLGKAEMVASAMAGLDRLTTDGVRQVVDLLNDVSFSRMIVADETGECLYDSAYASGTEGRYVLCPEIAAALEGNDVFYCRSGAENIESCAALPVIYRGMVIGCVYAIETDTEQAALLVGIQRNMRNITWLILLAVSAVCLVSVCLFSRRMDRIMNAIRIVREGEYSYKLQSSSHDELGELAKEFNALTERIQTTETMRRQFVSDASHELKTPLAAITLMTDSVLQNEMDKQTILEFVGDIGAEANRLSRMTEKLLQLSRLESAPAAALETVDLAKIVDKVFRILWPLANERGIRLSSHMEENCTVLAREDDIYQILFNVAENGVKYNRNNGTLEILLYRRDSSVVLICNDDGVGIPEDEMPRIFERFYRVDKARSREAGGSGIGLAIVHDMVEKYHGTITVAARKSGGSRFTITFPWYERGAEQ